MDYIPTASQTLGPFFRHGLERPAWSNLTTPQSEGEHIHISGRLIDGAREPVPDGMIEIWQADAAGNYPHADAAATDFRGFGRACTDSKGHFSFTTIKPGTVRFNASRPQAPHINVAIFARGLTRALVTRIYFAECSAENARDPILSGLGPDERDTLIAARANDASSLPTYHFDIVLQGERETVFLEI